MRRARIRPGTKKLDLVLTSARYDREGRLVHARGFERTGDVWTDIQIFERSDLIARLQARKRIVTGEQADLPGDFTVRAPVRLEDGGWIKTEGTPGGRDELAVPPY